MNAIKYLKDSAYLDLIPGKNSYQLDTLYIIAFIQKKKNCYK